MSQSRSPGKPFEISKWAVHEAYCRVNANNGTAGVDEVSIEEFETDLKNNLYKVWNRMSSGTYFPPPVRAVEIPKASGGVRTLGVPTVADRVARKVAMELEAGGTDVPSGFLWLSAETLGGGRGRGMPAKVLEKRLGDRFGHREVLRQLWITN
jgi:hypothetical protein